MADDGATRSWRHYAAALAAVGTVAVVGAPLLGHLDLANIAMLFPLAVLFAAVRLGRGPAVMAAFVSVVLFDVFFVPPHFTLVVSDLQYLLTFAVLLVVALITAELAAGLRRQRDMAEQREQQAQALCGMARDLSAALTVERIAAIAAHFASDAFGLRTVLYVPDDAGRLRVVRPDDSEAEPPPAATAVAERAFELGVAANEGGVVCVPLKGPVQVRGVVALVEPLGGESASGASEPLLDTISHLLAVALERLHYVTVAQHTELQIASERLRNSLLAALSHDLRTPLTAIAGLADTLALTPPPLAPAHAEFVAAIRDEALRTGALVNNLLDMARFQSGGVRLRLDWHPLEEIVGAALQARAAMLGAHQLVLDLPGDLPLVEIDGVLMERVLCNLLENAAKYTPPGSRIEVRGRVCGEALELSVCDSGPGLPDLRPEELFRKFARGRPESGEMGVGLGLAIVEAIISAHGGSVHATNRDGGGACFTIRLPLGEPPA